MSTPASEDVTLSLKEGEETGDSDNELKRKTSNASFYSTDGGEEDDDDSRKDAHVALGPQLGLKEQLEMDKVSPFPLFIFLFEFSLYFLFFFFFFLMAGLRFLLIRMMRA